MESENRMDSIEKRAGELLSIFNNLRQKKNSHSPDDLDLQDPEVIAANNQLDAWMREIDQQAQLAKTKRANYLANLKKTVFYIDAGFDDPGYLDEVAHDWLAQDLDNARAETEEDMTDVISMIEEKIASIESKIQ